MGFEVNLWKERSLPILLSKRSLTVVAQFRTEKSTNGVQNFSVTQFEKVTLSLFIVLLELITLKATKQT